MAGTGRTNTLSVATIDGARGDAPRRRIHGPADTGILRDRIRTRPVHFA